MRTLLSRTAFSVGARTFTWHDVALSAVLRGDWDPLVEQLRAGIALVRRAAERQQLPSEEKLEAAGAEFRYDRELVSAEEMEAWLERWHLTPESWMDYLERSLLRQTRAAEVEETISECPPEEDEVAEHVGAEAVCSGTLSRLAETLAGRAAIEDCIPHEAFREPAHEELERVLSGFPEAFARSGLARLGTPSPKRLEALARLELVFRAHCRRFASAAALRSQIDAHRLDWIRVEVQDLSFSSEAAAREAALCLREDGQSLEHVAASAHVAIESSHVYVGDLDPEVRPDLLSAGPGEFVGPLSYGDRFHLLLLRSKTPPSEEDAEVRRRAEDALLARVVDQETQARVRWAGEP